MDDFAALLARPARLEPAADAVNVELDAATCAQLEALVRHTKLPPALVIKAALRALEVELSERRRKGAL